MAQESQSQAQDGADGADGADGTDGTDGADGDEGAGTTTVYYLQTGWGIPSTPATGTDSTPGSWISTVPTAAVGKSIWFSLGTKPAGSSTWTFTAPQFYMGDLDYTIPGIFNDEWNINLGSSGLGILNLTVNDYLNSQIDLTVSGVGTVHGDNYTNSQYSASDFNITGLAGFSAGTYANSQISSTNVTGALGFTPYNATNPSGYTNSPNLTVSGAGTVHANNYTNTTYTAGDFAITSLSGYTAAAYANASLSSANVTNALTFTPYNATNPSSYTSSPDLTVNGAGTVHANNYTNTTYANLAALDSTANTKLSGIATSATNNGSTLNSSGNFAADITMGSYITYDDSEDYILITD